MKVVMRIERKGQNYEIFRRKKIFNSSEFDDIKISKAKRGLHGYELGCL